MEVIEATLKGRRLLIAGKDDTIYDAKTPRLRTTPNYTAYVKIAEGCDHRCAFCAIPLIRGSFRSRPMEDIVAEGRELAAAGVRELGSHRAGQRKLWAGSLSKADAADASARACKDRRNCVDFVFYTAIQSILPMS